MTILLLNDALDATLSRERYMQPNTSPHGSEKVLLSHALVSQEMPDLMMTMVSSAGLPRQPGSRCHQILQKLVG